MKMHIIWGYLIQTLQKPLCLMSGMKPSLPVKSCQYGVETRFGVPCDFFHVFILRMRTPRPKDI